MKPRISRAKLAATLHANGVPPGACREFADVAAAMIRVGVDEYLAMQFARRAYWAREGYTWKFTGDFPIHSHIERAEAARNPNGKCAEDIRARAEGRPSRWGTPEFHRAGG